MTKKIEERMGIAETRLEDHSRRLDGLENTDQTDRERREKNLIAGMWLCVKLAIITTVLTMTTPKVREAFLKIWGSVFS